MQGEQKVLRGVRWVARILAIVLFLFWGGFFLEHVLEWFIKPMPETPPLKIWLDQVWHLIMLLGFLVAFRWELVGGVMIILGTLLFFWGKGAPGWPGALYIVISIMPGILFLASWCRTRGTAAPKLAAQVDRHR